MNSMFRGASRPEEASVARQGKRLRALRRAWRTFWWMVVRPKPGQTRSRRSYLRSAVSQARCGVITGGEHSWGPLEYEYEGARRRKQNCRWCRASMTPASEIERTPPTDEDRRRWETMFCEPTEEDAENALKQLRREGIYRDGKLLWD